MVTSDTSSYDESGEEPGTLLSLVDDTGLIDLLEYMDGNPVGMSLGDSKSNRGFFAVPGSTMSYVTLNVRATTSHGPLHLRSKVSGRASNIMTTWFLQSMCKSAEPDPSDVCCAPGRKLHDSLGGGCAGKMTSREGPN